MFCKWMQLPATGIFTFPTKLPGAEIQHLLFLFIYLFKLLFGQSSKSHKVNQSQEIGITRDEKILILKGGQGQIFLWFLILPLSTGCQGHPTGHVWSPPHQHKMLLLLQKFQLQELKFWLKHSDCIITAEKRNQEIQLAHPPSLEWIINLFSKGFFTTVKAILSKQQRETGSSWDFKTWYWFS